ncbi:ubiquitin-conjugating enzyme E2 S [Kappamyces sp. JEL0829]|nr:ubiquitin-conjugating enzyme E2 S [Kappamyces sp. JEL0829]
MAAVSAQSIKKIAKELREIKNSPPEGIKIVLNEEDLTDIQAWIKGPAGTPFENGAFAVKISLGPNFPSAPPSGHFVTKIFHPNVAPGTGEICVSTLKKDWKPEVTLCQLLLTIKCLLIVPNPESALNEEAGKLLLEDYESYEKHAKLMTSIHAHKNKIDFGPVATDEKASNENGSAASDEGTGAVLAPKNNCSPLKRSADGMNVSSTTGKNAGPAAKKSLTASKDKKSLKRLALLNPTALAKLDKTIKNVKTKAIKIPPSSTVSENWTRLQLELEFLETCRALAVFTDGKLDWQDLGGKEPGKLPGPNGDREHVFQSAKAFCRAAMSMLLLHAKTKVASKPALEAWNMEWDSLMTTLAKPMKRVLDFTMATLQETAYTLVEELAKQWLSLLAHLSAHHEQVDALLGFDPVDGASSPDPISRAKAALLGLVADYGQVYGPERVVVSVSGLLLSPSVPDAFAETLIDLLSLVAPYLSAARMSQEVLATLQILISESSHLRMDQRTWLDLVLLKHYSPKTLALWLECLPSDTFQADQEPAPGNKRKRE